MHAWSHFYSLTILLKQCHSRVVLLCMFLASARQLSLCCSIAADLLFICNLNWQWFYIVLLLLCITLQAPLGTPWSHIWQNTELKININANMWQVEAVWCPCTLQANLVKPTGQTNVAQYICVMDKYSDFCQWAKMNNLLKVSLFLSHPKVQEVLTSLLSESSIHLSDANQGCPQQTEQYSS